METPINSAQESQPVQTSETEKLYIVSASPLTDHTIKTRRQLLEYLDDLPDIPMGTDPSLPENAPHWWEQFIWNLYSLMHRLGILWTPPPPYNTRFEWREAEDEFNRIRTRLRAEEAADLSAAGPKATSNSRPTKLPETEDGARPAELEAKPEIPPRKLLNGWREITSALNLKYNQRRNVKSLCERLQGPIHNKGKGKWPMVYRDELLAWWDNLTIMQQKLSDERKGGELSAEAQYNYGRDGIVAPEIGGGVKKRRKDRQA